MTLYNLFKQQSLQLPSVSERKKLYSGYKLGEDYVGSAEQNINLTKAIEKDVRAFDSFVKSLKTPKAVEPKEDIFKKEPVLERSDPFETRELTVGKTVGDWLKENKIEFEDFQKLNPAYKTPDFKVESPFKVRVVKAPKFLKDYPELTNRTGMSIAPIKMIKEPSELEKMIKQTIPNLLKEGIRKIPKLFVGDKNIFPQITSEIAKGIKQTKEFYKQKDIEKKLADKSKAKSISWNPKSILKSLILLTQPVALIERRADKKKVELEKKEVQTLIPTIKDIISGDSKVDISRKEQLILIQPKEDNLGVEGNAARLKRSLKETADLKEDFLQKNITLVSRGDEITGFTDEKGKYEDFYELDKDVKEAEAMKVEVEALTQKIGGNTAKLQTNSDESLKWQTEMFNNLEERTEVIFSIISDPDIIKDPSLLAKIFSIFPSRSSFMLGVTKAPEETLIQTPEVKELISELEGLYTERMKEILDVASSVQAGDEAASTKFWEGLTEKEMENLERVMTLNRLIGEKDDSTKIQKTWELMEDPYFQKALLDSYEYLSEEQKKFLKPIVEVARLNAERVILWPLVNKELESQSEEVKNLITEYQSLIDSINRRVVVLGDPSVSGTLAHNLVELSETGQDYYRSIKLSELKSEADRSEFLETYERARTFKSMAKARMNFLLGLGKKTEWQPWKAYKQSLFPGGFQTYLREGGIGMDLPRIVSIPIYHAAKFGWKTMIKMWDTGLAAVSTGIIAALDITSSGFKAIIENLGALYGYEEKDVINQTTLGEYPFKEDNFLSKMWNVASFNVFNLPDASRYSDIKSIPVGERFLPENIGKWVDFKRGGYIPQVFASQYHPRAYEKKLIVETSKPFDHLPKEFMGVREEFLQLNGLTENSVLKMGQRIMVPTEAFVSPRNLLDPKLVNKLEQSLNGRLSLLAFDFLGWVKLDPLTVFWSGIGSTSKSIMKHISPKYAKQLKTRKDLLAFSKQYSKSTDIAEDLASFITGDAVAEGFLKATFPGMIEARKALTSVRVLDNLDPRILNQIEKLSQKGELWRSGFFSKTFLDDVKGKIGKEKFKVFKEGLEGLMLKGKLPEATNNIVWEVLNQYGGDGFKMIQKIIKGTPKTFTNELGKLVKSYHTAEMRQYVLRKNLDDALKGLAPSERNAVLTLSQKTPAQITLELSRMKKLGKGISFKGKLFQRAEFNSKSIEKIKRAVAETKKNLSEIESIILKGDSIIKLPNGSKIVFKFKDGGKNYYDPISKVFVIEKPGNMGVSGVLNDFYSQVGKQATKYLDNTTAYFSESTLLKRYYLSYEDIVKEIKNGNIGLGHRLTDTLVKFNGEEIKLKKFLAEIKQLAKEEPGLPFKERAWKKISKNLPNEGSFSSKKWSFEIPVNTKNSSSVVEAMLKHIKFDVLTNNKWEGMSGSEFRTMLEKVAKIDNAFIPTTVSKTVYTTLPFQYGQASKALKGYSAWGEMPTRQAMQKLLKEESKKIIKVTDPKDFRAYFEEAMSLYFMKKYDPTSYVKYKSDIFQMFENLTPQKLNQYLNSHQKIALMIFNNEKKGIQSLPPSLISLLEKFTGNADDVKNALTKFLKGRIEAEKIQILKAEKIRKLNDFRVGKIRNPEAEWQLYKKKWSLDLAINPKSEEFSVLHDILKEAPILNFKKTPYLVPKKWITRAEDNYYLRRGRSVAEHEALFLDIQQGGRQKLAQILSKKIPKTKRIVIMEDLSKSIKNVKAQTYTYLPSNTRKEIDKEVERIVSKLGREGYFVIPESHKLSKYAYNKMSEVLPPGKVSLLKRHGAGKDRFAMSEAKAVNTLKELGQYENYTMWGAISEKDIFEFWSRVPEYIPRFKYYHGTGKKFTAPIEGMKTKGTFTWMPDLRAKNLDFRREILPFIKKRKNTNAKLLAEFISSPTGAVDDLSVSAIAQAVEVLENKKRILNGIFDSKSFYIQKSKSGKKLINFKGKGKLDDLDLDSIIYFSNGKTVGNISDSIRKRAKKFIYEQKYLDRLDDAQWPANLTLGDVRADLRQAFNLHKYSDRDQFAKVFKEVLNSKGKNDSAIKKLIRQMKLDDLIELPKMERDFYVLMSDLNEAAQRGNFLSVLRSEADDAYNNLNNLKVALKRLKKLDKQGNKYIYSVKHPSIEGETATIMKAYFDKGTGTLKKIEKELPKTGGLNNFSNKFIASKIELKKVEGSVQVKVKDAITKLKSNITSLEEYVPRVESMNKVFSMFDFDSFKIRNVDDFIDAIWDISRSTPSEKALALIGDWRGKGIKKAQGAGRLEYKHVDVEKVKLVDAKIKPLLTKDVTKFIELHQITAPKFIITDKSTQVSLDILKSLKEVKADLVIFVDLKVPKNVLDKIKRKAIIDSSKFFPAKSLIANKEEVALARRVRDAFYKNQRVVIIGGKAKKVKERLIDLFPPVEAEAYKGLFHIDRMPKIRKKKYPGPTYLKRKGKTPIQTGMDKEAKEIYSKTIPSKSLADWDNYLKKPSVPRLVEEIPAERTRRITDIILDKLEDSIEQSPDFKEFWIKKVKRVIGSKVKQVKVKLPEIINFNDVENLKLLDDAGIKLYVAKTDTLRMESLLQLKKEKISIRLISEADALKLKYSYAKGVTGKTELYERLDFFKRKIHSEIKSDVRNFFKEYKKIIPFSTVSMGDLRKNTYEWLTSVYKSKGNKALIKEWKETAVKMRKTYEEQLRAIIIKEFGTLNNKAARHIFTRKLSKFDELIKMAEELKLGFGAPTKIGFVSLISKLRAGLSTAFNWIIKKSEGPLSLGEEGMLYTIKGLDMGLKATGQVVSGSFRALRTFWIWNVLFLRPAWHINNQLGDTLRGTMVSKQVRYMMDSFRTYGLISASYLSFLGRDIKSLVWPLYRYFLPAKVRKYIKVTDPLVKTKKQILKQLNLTLRPNTAKNTYALKKILSQYEVTFNPRTIKLMNTKGPQGWTSKKLFKDMTSPKYWQRNYKIPMSTVNQSTHMGLLTALEDPILGAKMWKLMKETGIGSALRKRGALMKLDLVLFANMNEKMRRLLLLDNLMKTKAMSLAKASMKVRSYLFDYSHLSRAERVFRLVCPFWSFSRFSFELYSKMLLEMGSKFYWAGQFFIKSLEEASAGLPEQFKNRVKIPFTDSFAYLPFGIIDYWSFLANPREELMRFIDNPQQLPFGLGWDPGLALLLKNLTGKKWYQTSRILKDHTGWTDEEVKAEMERDNVPNINMTIDFPTMLTSFIPVMDLAGVIFPSLFKVDQATVGDELSLIGSKPIRSAFKFFGFNIMKAEPWMEFSAIYDRTAPHLRPFLIEQTKKEGTGIYEAWENMIAKSHMIKMLNARTKDEKDKAAHDMEKFIVVSKFYELEEKQKGLGDRWIEFKAREGNLTPKALMKEHWDYDIDDSSYRREQKAKFEKIKAKSILKLVEKEYVAKISPTTEAVLDVLNIPHPDVGFAEVFETEVFDQYGTPRFDTVEEAIEKIKELKERYSVPNLIPQEIRRRMDKETLEWKARSWEAKELKKIDDSKYYAKMSVAYSYIPENVETLSAEAQRLAFAKRDAYIVKMPVEYQKRWKESQPEYIIQFRELLNTAYEKIGGIYASTQEDPYNKNYYVEFQKLPQWIRNVHFVYHPEDINVIPFKAKLFEFFQEDRAQHLKGYSSNLRNDYYFSNDSLAVKARQDMDAEELAFQKLKGELSTKIDQSYKSGSLVGYYTLFSTMPKTWQDHYWELQENSVKSGWMKQEDYDLSKEWFEFNSKVEKARIQDNENLKNGIFSSLEEKVWSDSKWDKVKAWYEKNEMNKGYVEYSKLKFKFNKETKEEGPQNYYKFINELPGEAKWYYYRHHLDSIKYIDFMAEYTDLLVNEDNTDASDFLWDEKNKVAREAFFSSHPNEKYYIEYRERIFALSKDAGEYYDLILNAPQRFQDIYFRKHPLAKLYLKEVQRYFKAITLDTENKSKGIKSKEAKEVFESKSFQKALKVWDRVDSGVFAYYTGWYEISKQVDEKGIDKWGEIYEDYIATHPAFRKQLEKRQPEKYNILYPFKIKLWKTPSDKMNEFFFAPENKRARELMEEAEPGIIAYRKFWNALSDMAQKGHWNRYFSYYFSEKNKVSRLKHWENNPEAERLYPIWRNYQLKPAGNWEERRAKTKYLDSHSDLKAFFSKGTDDVKLRADIDEYFKIKNEYPDEGEGYSFFLKWKIQNTLAEKFLENHMEIVEYFQRFPKKYGDEESGYMQELATKYNQLPVVEKDAFLKAHPPLFDFLIRFSPPGVRKAIKLQREYFQIVSDDWDAKNTFVKNNPILKEYWEVNAYPKVLLLDPARLKHYKDVDKKIVEYYTLIKTADWSSGEKLRQLLPDFYSSPGTGEIGEWFKSRIYREAMSAWSSLLKRNQLGGITFFRALPEWLRNRYLEKHPEYNLMTQYPISRFAEEPLRKDLLSKAALRLHLAERMHYKYSPNLPWKIKERIKKEFIRAGVWESRAHWKKSDWQRYYMQKAIKKNNLFELDLHHNALLRKEFERLSKTWLTRGRILPFKKKVVPHEVELID